MSANTFYYYYYDFVSRMISTFLLNDPSEQRLDQLPQAFQLISRSLGRDFVVTYFHCFILIITFFMSVSLEALHLRRKSKRHQDITAWMYILILCAAIQFLDWEACFVKPVMMLRIKLVLQILVCKILPHNLDHQRIMVFLAAF